MPAEEAADALSPMLGREVDAPDLARRRPVDILVSARADHNEAEQLAVLFREVSLFIVRRERLPEELGPAIIVQLGQMLVGHKPAIGDSPGGDVHLRKGCRVIGCCAAYVHSGFRARR